VLCPAEYYRNFESSYHTKHILFRPLQTQVISTTHCRNRCKPVDRGVSNTLTTGLQSSEAGLAEFISDYIDVDSNSQRNRLTFSDRHNSNDVPRDGRLLRIVQLSWLTVDKQAFMQLRFHDASKELRLFDI
jgi:hypothetical protein